MKAFALGQRAEARRTFTPDDLTEYRTLAGIGEPAGGDGREPLPGPLLGSLFSYLLGTKLPGRGTNYLKQRLAYVSPAYPGEMLAAVVEIVRLRPEKDLVNLRTTCTGPDGRVVCEGEALVLVRDVRPPPD
jgi:hypothetical protein